jgi:hypothetical protein
MEPSEEEFFKRTLSRDFKTIYQRQLDIAERGIYREGRQLKVRFRPDKIVPGRTGICVTVLRQPSFR